jgi:beta-glucosidase
VNSSRECRNLIVVDDVLNTTFLDINSPAITIPQRFNYQRQIVDRDTLECILLDSRPTLLQVFIRGNPFRGNAGLTVNAKGIYQRLLSTQQIDGIIVYGSPYVLQWFKSIIKPDLPWAFSYGQMPKAQAIALEALFAKDSDVLGSKYTDDFGF